MKFRSGARFGKRLLMSLALSATLGTSWTLAEDAPAKPAAKADIVAAQSATAPHYTIGQCLSIAMERQPTLKAARAILAANQAGRQGLDELGLIGNLLTPELKFRKQQSSNGLLAAQAEMSGVEQEVTYSVVRTYYSAVFAREQYKLVQDLIVKLEVYLTQVKTIVNSKDGGSPTINRNTQDRLELSINEAVIRRNEAEAGINQAFAALREAMGIGSDEPLEIADSVLPEISAQIDREAVISNAVTRRSEIQLALIAGEVTNLEICAQRAVLLSKRVQTFANGTDIHAIPIPLGSKDRDYRPEAIGPRMPAQFVGHPKTRAAQAAAYADYAQDVIEKTRNLLTLEAENGFQNYRKASTNVKSTRDAVKTGKTMIDRIREAAGTKLDETVMLTSEGLVTMTNAKFNDTLIDQIIALANLERITAGGIHVNYPGR